MAIQIETLTSIYAFLGDFLAFLKSHRVLDSYIFAHSDVNDAVHAQKDEEFIEKLFDYVEQLQRILGTCSREKHYEQLRPAEPYPCFVETEKPCELPGTDGNAAKDNNPGIVWEENTPGFEVTTRTEFDALFEITQKADSQQPQVDCPSAELSQQPQVDCPSAEKSSTEEESDEETDEDDQQESTNFNVELTKEDHVNKQAAGQQMLPLIEAIPEGGPYLCMACDKEFEDRAALTRHFRKHTGCKPFTCEHCQKRFSSKVNLNAHLLRTHNIGIEKALSCSVCGKLFSRKNSLDVHMLIHKESKPFECHRCPRSFAQKISLHIHIASQHTGELNHSCEICDKSFVSVSALNTHRLSHGAARLQCDLCGQTFRRRDVLKVHREVRHGPPPPRDHRCPTCDKAFRTASQLAAHVQTHSTSSEPKKPRGRASGKRPKQSFLCSACGKKCCRLKDHVRRFHADGDGPATALRFACTYCPKTFVRKSKLQTHIVSHLEEPQYSCELCGSRFRRKDGLERHLARHTNPRPFSCDLCARRYSSRSSLRAHVEMRHTDRPEERRHTCSVCGKVYQQKNTFTEHMKTHTGEFRYQCDTCGKQFVKRSHYESHMRVHSSDRPFHCDTCKRTYKEQKHLREHVRRVHQQVLSLEALVASLGDEDLEDLDIADGSVGSAAAGVGSAAAGVGSAAAGVGSAAAGVGSAAAGVGSAAAGVGSAAAGIVQEVTLVAGHAEVAAVMTPFVVTGLPG